MCRLYAMHANEPTRVECGLVIAQNALMTQSQSDSQATCTATDGVLQILMTACR